jgi:mannose-6-phosphate isomerase-like protein (cupin superfamily)
MTMKTIEPDQTSLVEWRPGVQTFMRAGASTGAVQLCVLDQWCEPGMGAPAHTHLEVEELIAVLEGEAEVWVEEERARVGAGASVLIPPGHRHGFTNVGEDVLHVLAVLGAAAPPIEYDASAGTVYEIGGTREQMLDPHRAIRPAGVGS